MSSAPPPPPPPWANLVATPADEVVEEGELAGDDWEQLIEDVVHAWRACRGAGLLHTGGPEVEPELTELAEALDRASAAWERV